MMLKNKKYLIYLLLGLSLLIGSAAYAAEGSGEAGLVDRMAVLVFQIGIIIFAAWLGGSLFERLKFPAVLGEIIAGVLIGPYLFGRIPIPGFSQGVFPLLSDFPVSVELYSIAAIASIILLFTAGLQTDIDTFFRYSVAGSVVGLFGVIVSFTLGDLSAVLFSHSLGGNYGFLHPVSLFLGAISTATSVGISARILSEKKKMDSPDGITIISAAVIDDVLGIIILALVVSIAKSGHIDWQKIFLISLKAIVIWLGFTALGLIFSRQLAKFLKSFKDRITISLMAFAIALLLAGIFEKSGLAMIIGAYIIGLSLSKTDLSYLIQENLSGLQKFLVPLFFCVMGMLVNIQGMFSWHIALFSLVFVTFAIISKLLGCGIPALFLNFNALGALRIGVGMIPRGEVALIIAGIGLAAGIIPHDIFGVAILMTFVTTLVTPPLVSALMSSDKPVLRKEPPQKKERKEINFAMPNPDTAELMLNKVILAFENSGFYVHCIELPNRIFQIRKDETAITLEYSPKQLVFHCLAQDVSFIYTLFYEVIADLEYLIRNLQNIADKEKVGRQMFDKANGTHKEQSKLAGVISPFAVEVALKGTTKEELIRELTQLLIRSGKLNHTKYEEVVQDILRRESTMSTGMQDGITLPHAKTAAVERVIAAIGLKKSGVDFNSLDKKPANIFVLTLSPKEYPAPYLEFMAEMTKLLISPSTRQKILACAKNPDLYRVFVPSE
ncbi:MAG: cation:proton antiporter [Candidatus Omnitrophota bacterium]